MAAVAYVSDDSRIKFGRGDTLIVDASDEQISSGATSARVLADAVERGAQVYSLTKLHGKLIVFDETVVSSSANISDLSATNLKEIGIISDSPQLLRDAVSTIENLKRQSQRVDKQFIRHIRGIKVKHNGGGGDGVTRRQKPTLLDAFQANSPLLEDFVFLMFVSEATLTNSQIKQAAKKRQMKLPPTDRWEWYQFDWSKSLDNFFHKLFAQGRFKIVGLEVESDNEGIQRIVGLNPYALLYVNHIRIGKSIALNCLIDDRAPFKLGAGSAKAFCAELTRSLKSNPKTAKRFFNSRGILRTKDIAEVLQGKAQAQNVD